MTSLLADRLTQHRGAGQRLERAGRDRHPQVLADLDADDQALDVGGGEEAVGAERDGCAVEARPRRLRAVAAGGEPAALVELLVIGDERLGHEAEHPAAVQHGGAVEDLVVHRQRQADDGQAGEDVAASPRRRGPGRRGRRAAGSAAGTGRRRCSRSATARGRRGRATPSASAGRMQGEDALGVEGAVGDAQRRARRRRRAGSREWGMVALL